MRSRQAVWRAGIVFFLRTLDEPGRFPRGVLYGNDLVILTMHNQSWDVDPLEILGEIGLGEGLDAFISVLEARLHAPKPELFQYATGDLGPRPVGTIKRSCQILVELRAVVHDAASEVVEDFYRQTFRIGRGLQHDWRHSGEKYYFGDPFRLVPSNVADDFAAARGMANERRVF